MSRGDMYEIKISMDGILEEKLCQLLVVAIRREEKGKLAFGHIYSRTNGGD